jgi:hypothetical protein
VTARLHGIPALAVMAAAALVVACGVSTGSLPPTAPGASSGSSTSGAATTATVAPPPATPEAPPARELVVGCISVDDAECRFLAQRIVAVLPAGRGPAFAVEIQLYPCENPNLPCPKSLSARPGKAVVEFLDRGEPIELSLQGPPLTPEIAPQDAFYLGLTNPSSPRVAGIGAVPFDVGHCGVSHVIDFDGSFWVPIGQVDGDHPTIINSESGQMRLLGPNLGEFRGDSGFTVQLARFPGPKHFWGSD